MQAKELSLFHLIRPAKTANQPATPLFLFHGYGSNEEDLFSLLMNCQKNYSLFLYGRHTPLEPFGYAWYAINFDADQGKWSDNEQAIASRDKMLAFIEEACDAYELNERKVSILGFSQGCILSYALALSYPDKIKNVIGLSGYINLDILKERIPRQ